MITFTYFDVGCLALGYVLIAFCAYIQGVEHGFKDGYRYHEEKYGPIVYDMTKP